VRIDEVAESDWATWKALRLAALQDAPDAFGSRFEDWRDAPEERWRHRLHDLRALNLIGSIDGDPCGMASGVPGDREGTVELISMWVAPSARGSGLSDELIDRVVQWAALRTDEVWLAVVPGNERAMALYRRHGFERMEEVGDELPDGSGHEILMRRRITNRPLVRTARSASE
jgi:ribosomal protein S18 acetylase RimI-like enzyme